MSASRPDAAARDNLLGICAALGEDFGFNPFYLRVALAAGMLWSASAMIGLYLGLGLVVVLSRLLARPRKAAAQRLHAVASEAQTQPAIAEQEEEALARAA